MTDLSNSSGAAVSPAASALNGTYNADLFAEEAVRLIAGSGNEPLYCYLAFQNTHCAAQDKVYLSGSHPLHAPCSTVDGHYAETQRDTWKVMGAMVTELDTGVGRVVAQLTAAKRPWLLCLNSDNGGPLEHSSNAPLRGGKHTLWEGGVRVVALISGPLVPPARRGATWPGMAHVSDWYRTLAVGVAGCPAQWTNGTGPRPSDGFNLLPALLAGGPSPRTEVVHQVVNDYSRQKPSVFPAVMQAGRYKLFLNGHPGDSRLVSWPAPGAAMEFGKTNGSRNGYPGETDNCRATTVPKTPGGADTACVPGCLFDLEQDLSESHNLFNDSALQHVVADLTARLAAAAATGPPWAVPFNGTATRLLQAEICDE